MHLDLNLGAYSSFQDLEDFLDDALSHWETQSGIKHMTKIASLRFGDIIAALHESTAKKVVILIDEYDKPMLNAIDNDELATNFGTRLEPS